MQAWHDLILSPVIFKKHPVFLLQMPQNALPRLVSPVILPASPSHIVHELCHLLHICVNFVTLKI